MFYHLLADLILVIHLLFILFVAAGGLLVFKSKHWAWLHIPAFLWGTFIEFAGWVCPLTPLENWLRKQGGESIYRGGFIEHYLLPIIYPPGLTRNIQIALGIFVLIINLVIYGLFIYRTYKRKNP